MKEFLKKCEVKYFAEENPRAILLDGEGTQIACLNFTTNEVDIDPIIYLDDFTPVQITDEDFILIHEKLINETKEQHNYESYNDRENGIYGYGY